MVVAGKVISQGEALNRGVLVQSIIKDPSRYRRSG
ncbi:glutaredoxin-like protein [Vibrio cholerae]|nr:glutaredoxin-like protein [Vibrio cholerae]